jgi:hypothetical protein
VPGDRQRHRLAGRDRRREAQALLLLARVLLARGLARRVQRVRRARGEADRRPQRPAALVEDAGVADVQSHFVT